MGAAHGVGGASSPSVWGWLPDETLYSWACRECALACCSRPQWLGGRTAPHDLPFSLDGLGGPQLRALGGSRVASLQHTLLPYYLAFQPMERRTRLLELALRGDLARLKASLGLYATKLGAAHPLKACVACMEEDVDQHGVAYWHVAHQFPGVWMCLRHDQPLLVASEKWNGVHRLAFLLPQDAQLQNPTQVALSDGTRHALLKLAGFTQALLEMATTSPIPLERTQAAYDRALQGMGLAGESGRLSSRDIEALLGPALEALCLVDRDLAAVRSATPDFAGGFTRLATGTRPARHPLKHLLLATALFPSRVDFVREMGADRSMAPPGRDSQTAGKPNRLPHRGLHPADQRIRALVALLDGPCSSLAAAAQELGVSHATAQAWAATAGVTPRRRPKRLNDELRQSIITALGAGCDKAQIAHAHGVSVETVTRVLRTEIGLQGARAQALQQLARDRARNAWSEAAHSWPQASRKALRSLCPAAFSWLYRHDRDWLLAFVQDLPKAARSPHPRVDWAARDREFTGQIQRFQALWQLLADPTRDRLTVARVCLEIPRLRTQLGKLARMPLTRQLLRQMRGPRGGAEPCALLEPGPHHATMTSPEPPAGAR